MAGGRRREGRRAMHAFDRMQTALETMGTRPRLAPAAKRIPYFFGVLPRRSDISLNVALETMKAAAEEGYLHNEHAVRAHAAGGLGGAGSAATGVGRAGALLAALKHCRVNLWHASLHRSKPTDAGACPV